MKARLWCKNKNGTEIYTGDILNTRDYYKGGVLVFKGKVEVTGDLCE